MVNSQACKRLEGERPVGCGVFSPGGAAVYSEAFTAAPPGLDSIKDAVSLQALTRLAIDHRPSGAKTMPPRSCVDSYGGNSPATLKLANEFQVTTSRRQPRSEPAKIFCIVCNKSHRVTLGWVEADR